MNVDYVQITENVSELVGQPYYDESYQYFIARDAEQNIVGALGYMTGDEALNIEVLYVDTEYRGRGIATRLLQMATYFAQVSLCDRVLVSVILDTTDQEEFIELMLQNSFLYPDFSSHQYKVKISQLKSIDTFKELAEASTDIKISKISEHQIRDCKRTISSILNPDHINHSIGHFMEEFSYQALNAANQVVAFIIFSSLENDDLLIDSCMLKDHSYSKVFLKILGIAVMEILGSWNVENNLYMNTITDSSEKLVEHLLQSVEHTVYVNAETGKII